MLGWNLYPTILKYTVNLSKLDYLFKRVINFGFYHHLAFAEEVFYTLSNYPGDAPILSEVQLIAIMNHYFQALYVGFIFHPTLADNLPMQAEMNSKTLVEIHQICFETNMNLMLDCDQNELFEYLKKLKGTMDPTKSYHHLNIGHLLVGFHLRSENRSLKSGLVRALPPAAHPATYLTMLSYVQQYQMREKIHYYLYGELPSSSSLSIAPSWPSSPSSPVPLSFSFPPAKHQKRSVEDEKEPAGKLRKKTRCA